MAEAHATASFQVSRDLLQHYNRKYDETSKAKLNLQDELEFKQGELINERRMRQWLETRLDTVVHALASKEGTHRYKEEYKADDLITSVLVHTKNDLMNEKRLREKLEETVAVIERAKDIECVRKKCEDDSQMIAILQNTLETTEVELIKEKEMVRVLEETIADLEKSIVEDITRDESEEEEQKKNVQDLENAQCDYMAERKLRQTLQRKLAELEASMPNSEAKSIENIIKTAEDAETLERMHDDLLVERNVRQRLLKKLKSKEEDSASSSHTEQQTDSKEEENMLQSLLRCTLDKLSNERQVRRALEEKLEVLEQKVMKEQAKTKLEEICLELTQNELSQEREVRQSLEQHLASLEVANSDGFIALPAEGRVESVENFEERLDALDKIIMSIKEQNKLYVEEHILVDEEKQQRIEEAMEKIQKQSRETFNNIVGLKMHECLSSSSSGVSSAALSAMSSETSSECNEVSLKYCMELIRDDTLEHLKDEPKFSLGETSDKWQIIGSIVNDVLEPDVPKEHYNPEEMAITKNYIPLEWKKEEDYSIQNHRTNEQDHNAETVFNIPVPVEDKVLNHTKLQAGKESETEKENLGVVEVTVNIALPLMTKEEVEYQNKIASLLQTSGHTLQDASEPNASQGKEGKELQDDLEEKLAELGVIKRTKQEPGENHPMQDNLGTAISCGKEDDKLHPQDKIVEEKLAEMGAIRRRNQELVEYQPLPEDSQPTMSQEKEEEKLSPQDNTLQKLTQLGAIMKRSHNEAKILHKVGKKNKLPSVYE